MISCAERDQRNVLVKEAGRQKSGIYVNLSEPDTQDKTNFGTLAQYYIEDIQFYRGGQSSGRTEEKFSTGLVMVIGVRN